MATDKDEKQDGSRKAELRGGPHHGVTVRLYPTRQTNPDFANRPGNRAAPYAYVFEDLVFPDGVYVVPHPMPDKNLKLHYKSNEETAS